MAEQFDAVHVQIAGGDRHAAADLLRDLQAGLLAVRRKSPSSVSLSVELPAAGASPVVKKVIAAGGAAGPPTIVC